jgi:hypothetical protein
LFSEDPAYTGLTSLFSKMQCAEYAKKMDVKCGRTDGKVSKFC